MANYKTQLEPYMGRYFRQKGEESVHRFLNFDKLRIDTVMLKTDLDVFNFSVYDIKVFLEMWEEVEKRNEVVILVPEKQKIKNPQAPVSTYVPVLDEGTIINLRDVLLGNIKKVQEDPGYANKAKTINNTVQTLINLAVVDLKIKANQKQDLI